MIHLDITVNEGKAKIAFNVPDKPGEEIILAELAVFALYLDVIRRQITEITTHAVYKTEGYDLQVDNS